MKKLVLIVGLVLIAASCQKEQIAPRNASCASGNSAIMETPVNDEDPSNPNTISSSNGTTVSGDNTSSESTVEDEGDITDPMRKKERKGN